MAKRYFIAIYNVRQEQVWLQAVTRQAASSARRRRKERSMVHAQCIKGNKTVAFGHKSIVSTLQNFTTSALVLSAGTVQGEGTVNQIPFIIA